MVTPVHGPPLQLVTKEPMGSIGRYTDVGDGPSGACYGRRGWALRGMVLVLGPMDGWAVFFVLGTYGGWVATLENPFGTLEALETLGTLCVALCGDKGRTNFLSDRSACMLPFQGILVLPASLYY